MATMGEMMEAWVTSEGFSPFDNTLFAARVLSNPHPWHTERGIDFSHDERLALVTRFQSGDTEVRTAYITVLKDRADLQETYRREKCRWSSWALRKLNELGVEYQPRPAYAPIPRIRGRGNTGDIVLRVIK